MRILEPLLAVLHWEPLSVVVRRLRGLEQEPVHKLAWTLDACLKDRVIDERRLRELNHFLSTFDRQQAQLAAAGRGQY